MLESITPTFIIAILVALSVHECAHAWVADKLGDPTARFQGRVTLNPISHLDPLGTILFIVVGFGWGKPVPVNPTYFKHYKRDTALVAAAGPASNLILAVLAFALIIVFGLQGAAPTEPVVRQFFGELLSNMMVINLVLMAFNLLPIAPLDGSKVLHLWVPLKYEDDYQSFMQKGPWILLGLIILGRFFHIDVLQWWINLILSPILSVMDYISLYI